MAEIILTPHNRLITCLCKIVKCVIGTLILSGRIFCLLDDIMPSMMYIMDAENAASRSQKLKGTVVIACTFEHSRIRNALSCPS
jgi:hypothetical protein